MIYRGLYHFYVAHHKGLANDPIKYFADPVKASRLQHHRRTYRIEFKATTQVWTN
jgi:hypothetical protein